VNSIADQPVFFKLTCAGAAVLPVAQFSAPDSICPGACIDFTNLSQNANSYLWNFPGGNPSVSTDENPLSICYNTPGNYNVTLIAANANGNDTLLLTNYITVYPQPPPQGILQTGDTLFANAGAVNYQWYYNGSLINGATEYFYIADQSGDYNVVATDANGCEVEAVINNVIASLTTPSKEGELTIYPNPVEEMLYVIDSKLHGTAASISIYNVLGEKIMDASLSDGIEYWGKADVSILPAGLYFIELGTEDKIYRTKFIKH
jgi:PKD repeat protein